jgi:hypothetical protein
MNFFADLSIEEASKEWLFKEGVKILKRFYDKLTEMRLIVMFDVNIWEMPIPYAFKANIYHDRIIEWIDKEADKIRITNLKKLLKELTDKKLDIKSTYKYDLPPDIRDMIIYMINFRQKHLIHSLIDHINEIK